MVLYSFYLFNKYGDNIFQKQWSTSFGVQEEKARLVGGLIYTLNHCATQLSSAEEGRFKALQTPLYKLHYFETITGYRAALMSSTDLETNFTQRVLAAFFSEVFTGFVSSSLTYEHAQGIHIEDPSFETVVENFFKKNNMIGGSEYE